MAQLWVEEGVDLRSLRGTCLQFDAKRLRHLLHLPAPIGQQCVVTQQGALAASAGLHRLQQVARPQ